MSSHINAFNNSIEIPIFAKFYTFYKYFSQFVINYPKSKRYTLASKVDQLALDIIELIINANYSYGVDKLKMLKKIGVKLDLLKVLIRLSFETKCIDSKKYQSLSSQLVEIGRMLGGWIKSINKAGC